MGIEDKVIRKIERRREQGYRKYGKTMERSDLTKVQWLQHAQEEALDLAIYLEKLIQMEMTPSYEDVIKQIQRR